jgi:hypothetical protein
MTLSLGDTINALDALIQEIEAGLPQQMEVLAMDGLALIQDRIQTTGKDSKGNSLKPYTVAYRKWKDNPQNTKRGKELGLGSSRYSGTVDYTLTGDTWKNTKVISVDTNDGRTVAVIGPITEHSQMIMGTLKERDGESPITLSQEEIAILQENQAAWLNGLIGKYFTVSTQ